MKARINEEGFFRGHFPDEFITENWDSFINGDFVYNWILVDTDSPETSLMKPKWDGTQWIEGATPKEILDRNKILIESLSADYRGRINAILLPYLPDLVIDDIPIPQHILLQRSALQSECDLLIKAIDPNQSMSKPSKTNYK